MKRMIAGTLLALAAGCGSLSYQSMTPSFRTMADDPRMSDYYVGADAHFALVDPTEVGRSIRPAATVRDYEPMDVWNTPVPWDPADSRASVSPMTTRESTTSVEP